MSAKQLIGWIIIVLMILGFVYIVVDMIMTKWWLILIPIGVGVGVGGLFALACYLINSPNKKNHHEYR